MAKSNLTALTSMEFSPDHMEILLSEAIPKDCIMLVGPQNAVAASMDTGEVFEFPLDLARDLIRLARREKGG